MVFNLLKRKAYIFLVILFALLAGNAARAQDGIPAAPPLVISDTEKSYPLAPFAYITRDPAKKLNFQAVYEKHLRGPRGEAAPGRTLTLGSTGAPHWIVFSVENKTRTERWVISFGDYLSGRAGLIGDIFLYDQASRARYIDTVSPNTGKRLGTATTVTIPRNSSAMFFLYVVPRTGAPATITPTILAEDLYTQKSNSPLNPSRLYNFFLAAMVGLFLSAALFQRYGTALHFAVYYALQAALFSYHQGRLATDFPLASEISVWLFAAIMLNALITGVSFLGIQSKTHRTQLLATGMGVLLVIVCVIASPLVPATSGLRTAIAYGAGLPVMLFLVVLSLAQRYMGRSNAGIYAAAWLISIFGFAATALGTVGVLTPSPALVGAYWLSLIPQAFLFSFAVAGRFLAQSRKIEEERIVSEEELDHVSELRQNREAAENQRLHRLIEHERQIMNELRDREIKQNEEMRKAKEVADEANRSKSAFLAVVSHEIRTPMTGIMGMVRLLLESNLAKQQYDYAQTIQDSGNAMMALLNDILDFEKIESGKMEIEKIDFDLHRVLNGIVTLMSGHASAKSIYLKLDMDQGVPRYVVGDAVRLRQVLLNLAGNSIKFTNTGGVTISVKFDHGNSGLPVPAGLHRIRFSVIDTGIGISKEAQKSLFNPFAQADSSISRKFGGTGLGLAISQRLIEAMGGKILIDSVEGEGSSFYFIIDLPSGSADATRENMGQKSSFQKSGKSLKIMIVEDNEINRKLMKEFVGRMGHEIELAESGEQALEIIKEKSFDLVLMDVQLPGISGMGTTKAIRALPDRGRAATPVLALTGNVRDEEIRQCYAANMNGHLAKPVDPHKLKLAIEKVIAGKLDNPVVLPEPATGSSSGTINRIDPVTIPAPGPEQTAQPPAQNQHASDETGDHVSPADTLPAPVNLRELAMSIDETDLEEDSFEQALRSADTIEKSPQTGIENSQTDLLDRKSLQSLRSSMDQKSFADLMASLFEKTDEILRALDTAQEQGDTNTLMARLHELKGMAGNFGMKDLAARAERAERALKDNQIHDLGALLSSLPAAEKRARSTFDEWMKE